MLLKAILLLLPLLIVALHPPADDPSEWKQFKKDFNKVYSSPEEESQRYENFVKSMEEARTLNEEHEGQATFGINQFSDQTLAEFSKNFNTLENDDSPLEGQNREDIDRSRAPARSVDYRTSLKSTKWIKNQGQCESCYIFSALGAIEAHVEKNTGMSLPLSDQMMLDCLKPRTCFRGTNVETLNYVRQHGVLPQNGYKSYSAVQQRCGNTAGSKVYIDGHQLKWLQGNETRLAQNVDQKGPVSGAIHSSIEAVKHYRGGILTSPSCLNRQADHAILIIGYGTDAASGQDYWLIKNSWGTSWGEQG